MEKSAGVKGSGTLILLILGLAILSYTRSLEKWLPAAGTFFLSLGSVVDSLALVAIPVLLAIFKKLAPAAYGFTSFIITLGISFSGLKLVLDHQSQPSLANWLVLAAGIYGTSRACVDIYDGLKTPNTGHHPAIGG